MSVTNTLIKHSIGGDTVLQCVANANPVGKVVWTFGPARDPVNASVCSILANREDKYCIGEHSSFSQTV